MLRKKYSNKHIIEFIIHFCVWVGYPYFKYIWRDVYYVIGYTNFEDGSIYTNLFFGVIFNAIIFYGIAFWLIPKYLANHKYLYFGLITLLFFAIVSGIEYFQEQLVIKYYHLNDDVNKLVQAVKKIKNSLLTTNLSIVLLAFLYRFSRDWVGLMINNRRLVKENHLSELNFLRSQVNPHFLFNTLNNLYGTALKEKADKTAEKIDRLSGMMRYMIYDSNESLVYLKDEIKYIKDYIEIQQLRFSKEDPIKNTFILTGKLDKYMIPPMLLIPFIENAYKHGLDFTSLSFVNIKILIENDFLKMYVENSNKKAIQNQRNDESGIGLENVKKRLQLLYPDRKALNISSNNDKFIVELNIPLKK